MAGGIDWFRWHHGSVNDQKFGLVAKKAGASVAEVIAVWACILEAASASGDRGNPGVLDFEAMDYALGLDEGKAQAIYSRMQDRSMIETNTGRIASWDKRQPKRERDDDNSTERSRKHRAMQRQETPETMHATPCNTMQRQETPRGEESREELSISEQAVEVETSPPAQPAATTKAVRGSRLPADWQLPKAWGEWALLEKSGWTADDVRRCADKFCDHWHAASGKTATKADWLATWRNWVRNEQGPPARASPQFDARSADRKRAIAEFTGVPITELGGNQHERIEREINPAPRLAVCVGG